MQKYRVTGGRTILGHEPGSEFEADLNKAHEERLLKNGFIEVVEESEPEPVEEKPVAPKKLSKKDQTVDESESFKDIIKE